VAKDQAVKLQILDGKHPGLLRRVDSMLEKFAGLRQVSEMIKTEYHEDAGHTSVTSYKQKFYQKWRALVQEQKATMKAIAEIIGEDGLEAGVHALLWQSLQTMKPMELIALKRGLNGDKKVELMKKRLALSSQEHRQKMQERRAAMEAQQEGSAPVDAAEDYARAQRVVQQVKEIFGIGMTPIEPPEPPRPEAVPAPALPPSAEGTR
jgi:hypothetical protein